MFAMTAPPCIKRMATGYSYPDANAIFCPRKYWPGLSLLNGCAKKKSYIFRKDKYLMHIATYR